MTAELTSVRSFREGSSHNARARGLQSPRPLSRVKRRICEGVVSVPFRILPRIVVDIAKTARVIDSDPDAVDAALRDRPGVPANDLAEFRRLLARR